MCVWRGTLTLLPPPSSPPPPHTHTLPPAQRKKRKPSAALANLDSLSASLREVAASEGGAGRRQFGSSVGTQRGRMRVAEVETTRLQQVLQHPQFLANPLAAISSHLAAIRVRVRVALLALLVRVRRALRRTRYAR